MLRAKNLVPYLASLAATAVATALCGLMNRQFALSNLVMVYLAGVAVVAASYGLKPAVLASITSVAAFDFFFVHPRWTFAVSDTQYWVTFGVMLLVALIISSLSERVSRHAKQAQAERMRSTLLAAISHDLRTPLTSIAGAADSLRRGEGDTKALADMVFSESMRLNVQVRNLLDLTRLQSGTIKLNKEWVSLEDQIGSALNRASEVLTGHTVEVRIDPGLPLIEADEVLMDKVFANLLENAAMHTPSGSVIKVEAKTVEGILRIAVSDNGPGLPGGQEEAVFEQFAQAAQHAGGSGLGLTICRIVIKLHGGTIRASNQPGGGASFIIRLPLPHRQPEVPNG